MERVITGSHLPMKEGSSGVSDHEQENLSRKPSSQFTLCDGNRSIWFSETPQNQISFISSCVQGEN